MSEMTTKTDPENIQENPSFSLSEDGVPLEGSKDPKADGEQDVDDTEKHDADTDQRLFEKDKEIQILKDTLLRQAADAENMRKRLEREKDEMAKYATTKIARDILEIADGLARALEESAMEKEAIELLNALREGVTTVHKQTQTIFKRHGIQEVAAEKGQKFDPNLHQAMCEVPTEEVEKGHIVQVMISGYMIHDRLLRPACVSVAKKGSQDS